ncbi:MAG: hypothetical protein JKX81_14105 [Arenicella sp.]|nr:hypothetical protein [Arenicella sp.]
MKKIAGLISVAAILISSAQVHAQHVGTIGIGDITYNIEANSGARTDLRSPEYVLSALNNGISGGLTKIRKFKVLGYPQLTARIDEQDRTLDGYYKSKYTGNALLQAGLDYILKANVSEFGIVKQESGKPGAAIGLMVIEFKLIGVADATNDLSSKVIARVYRPKDPKTASAGDQAAAQQLLDRAIQQAIKQLVDQVVTNLFPIRVMKISENGVITLNYGKGLLKVGDTVMVYPIGTDTTVDEFGEPVGVAISSLQITSTEKKFAVAKIVDKQQELKKGQKGQLILTGG